MKMTQIQNSDLVFRYSDQLINDYTDYLLVNSDTVTAVIVNTEVIKLINS